MGGLRVERDGREARCWTGRLRVGMKDGLHEVGTVGLELQEQVAEQLASEPSTKKVLDAIITPCGGGGLTSGVALSVRLLLSTPSCSRTPSH